jgi:hypothetical protein
LSPKQIRHSFKCAQPRSRGASFQTCLSLISERSPLPSGRRKRSS